MRITRKDLEEVVNDYNNRYCQNTKHHLQVDGAYNGYKVVLTGKPYKNSQKWRGRLGSGCYSITDGYQTARDTINAFYKQDYNGAVKSSIKYWEKLAKIKNNK
jgi:hypothetical protein